VTIGNRTATAAESASATSVQATLPTGTTTADVVVAFLTVPGTLLGQHSGTPSGSENNIISAYYRVKNGSWSAGPTVSTSAAASRTAATCQAYTGVNIYNPLDSSVASAATAPYGTGVTIPQVTTATPGARLISGAICDSSTNDFSPTAPAGMTRIATTNGIGDGIAGRGMSLADEVLAAAGATGTRTWSTGVSLGHGGFLVALRPALSGPPRLSQPNRIWRIH
jgi:hypothetical protein